ncbi:MAG: endonuclease III [Peptoclostridium sp.]|uniref:endonuclease III n=1 Tax=Peptoclostridium sp. TaxID=1904860 RepID=UPI00139ECF56|nr:endonuclease III [Peptoclostridium sp.]MZQ75457.1 endonuclease III [Peptoclostridium sp.]
MIKVDSEHILEMLANEYPDAKCELSYKTPFELLVATILSAQCTDVRVNIITGDLFKEYNEPDDFAYMKQEKLEELIRSCGFYKNKAKSIIGASQMIIESFAGNVPDKMEELLKLPGVGRKTANVILSNAFSRPAIAVDTHVFRVSRRIGLASGNTPDEVERELMDAIPISMWSLAHHLLIFHGRRRCTARKPQCEGCCISRYCKYYTKGGNRVE